MFTGIVETIGRIESLEKSSEKYRVSIAAQNILDDVQRGDSIAVNGVCLTVVAFDDRQFTVDIVPQTLRLSNLTDLSVNDRVNLERALSANRRFGGHMVQGHVDTTATIVSIVPDGDAVNVEFALDESFDKYLVKQGFISVDGISLTIVSACKGRFTVTLIPETREHTIAQHYCVGKKVNIEVDMMGKYVVKFLEKKEVLV